MLTSVSPALRPVTATPRFDAAGCRRRECGKTVVGQQGVRIDGGAAHDRVRVGIAVLPPSLVAVTVKLNVPPAVGVPEYTPEALSAMPGGSAPAVTDQLIGAVPVAAESSTDAYGRSGRAGRERRGRAGDRRRRGRQSLKCGEEREGRRSRSSASIDSTVTEARDQSFRWRMDVPSDAIFGRW